MGEFVQVLRHCDARVFGISPAERLRRQRGSEAGPVVVADASVVLGDSALKWLLRNPGQVLTTPSGRPAAVAVAPDCVDEGRDCLLGQRPCALVNPDAMDEVFSRKLRRRDKLLVRSLGEQPRSAIENELFRSVYKGVTDVVTKYAWPLPALWVTRLLAAMRVTPNAVTIAGMLAMLFTLWRWIEGDILGGLVSAWLMTFLDTVDGKLARVTATSSELGNILDHATDIIHPPIWWAALAYGLALQHPGETSLLSIACIVIIASYVVGRVLEVLFKRRMGYNAYLWRPFDSAFRLVIARRNTILLLISIGLILGVPVLFYGLCALWGVVSSVVQAVRYVQARREMQIGSSGSWIM